MTRLTQPLLATLLAVVPFVATAQAVTPEDHPGFLLAEAVAAQGCVLHQDDVNGMLEELGLENAQFPQMAVPLMRDGFLMPSGQGTMTLVNWGLCVEPETDAEASMEPAQSGDETTPSATE
ncbi:hypothetical protein K3728_14900 [Rhodobacteraceae bacterium M385]|nr:hypothetical protein K3728_14900 [Rhodobacteraceae bacterium M385]